MTTRLTIRRHDTEASGPGRRRTTIPAAAIALTLGLLGACSAPPEDSGQDAGTTSTAHTSAATRPNYGPTPTTATGFDLRIDELDYFDDFSFTRRSDNLLIGPRTVAVDSAGQGTEFTIFGTASATPGVAHIVRGEESEVDVSAASAQGDPGAASGLVAVTRERLKSQGLESDDIITRIETFDDSGRSLDQVTLEETFETEALDVHYWGSTVLITYYEELSFEESSSTTLAVDLDTGTTAWTEECRYEYAEDHSTPVVGGKGTVLFRCKKNAVARDIADGGEKWSGSYAEVHPTPAPNIAAGLRDEKDEFGYPKESGYDLLAIDTGEVFTTQVELNSVFDATTGLLALNNLEPVKLALDWDDPLDLPAFEVIDTATGDRVFAREVEELADFGELTLLGAFDGRLWIWGDDGPDVIRLADGEQDALAPSKPEGYQHSQNVPMASGVNWVIIGTTNGLGDASEGQIARSGTGDFTAEDLPATKVVGLG